MTTLLAALKSYLYGIGWLCIAITASVIALQALNRFSPFNFRQEMAKQNTAVALFAGLFLFALIFGILYMAAHI